jgi:mono/diheme cytochrome c family protein
LTWINAGAAWVVTLAAMTPKLLALAVAVMLPAAILAGPAVAQAPRGDVAEGQRLAEQLCARCHVMPPNQGSGWTDAPSFAAIANKPTTTAQSLRDIIEQPHVHMSGTGLGPAQSADLAAYILSLRQP